MARLRDVRHWREEFGMGTSGGPVRVARSEEEQSEAEPEELAEAFQSDEADGPPRGGIASPEGASVEIDFDWE
jgi:hypothetical protein